MSLCKLFGREVTIALLLAVVVPVAMLTDICCDKDYSSRVVIAVQRIESGENDDESTD